MPAHFTTEYYSDDSDDSEAPKIVNKSDIFSIYCPRINCLCLSAYEHLSAPNSQHLTGNNDNSQDSQKQKLRPKQNSVSDQNSLENSTVKTHDSLAARTKDSLTLKDRQTIRKNKKTNNWTANIPKLAKFLAPPRPCKKQHETTTPNNVAHPFYSRPHPDTAIPYVISFDDDENEPPSTPASRLHNGDNISTTLDIPTPKKIDAPPSPAATFLSCLFSPLFSRLSSNDSAFDSVSTSTGITDVLEQSNDTTLEFPYCLDNLHIPCPDDNILDPIHHVPFLQHHSDLDSRTNLHASLLFYADATIHDEINGPVAMRNLPACVDSSTTAASFCLRYIQSSATTKQCIRDMTTVHLCHLMCKLYPLLTTATDPDLDNNQVEFTQCIQHTLTELPIWLWTTSPQSSDLTSQKAYRLLSYRFSMTMNLDLLEMNAPYQLFLLSRCYISSTFTFKSNLLHAPTSLLNLPISFAIFQHLR
jgi:hypothetical protein